MPFRQVAVSGLPAIALRTDELEVVAVPAAGMKLTNLRRPRGREWLWRNDQIPLARPRERTPPSWRPRTAAAGTSAFRRSAPVPFRARRRALPSFRTTASSGARTWTSSAYEHAGGVTLAAATAGRLLPYDSTASSPSIPTSRCCGFRYRVRHTGDSPFPWIWCAHPLFNVQPGTTHRAAVAASGEGGRGARADGAGPGRHRELARGVRRRWRPVHLSRPGCLGGEAVR